jgi:hypothetical protein
LLFISFNTSKPLSFGIIRSSSTSLGFSSFTSFSAVSPSFDVKPITTNEIRKNQQINKQQYNKDLIAAGSMTEAKSQGKVRMEGKDYVMHDGDVVEFRFNV